MGGDVMWDARQVCPLVARQEAWDGEGRAPCRVVEVGGVRIGGPRPVVIAGPCAVEERESLIRVARKVQQAGALMLRGGAFKGRTSPYSFQGLGVPALEMLAAARAATGLPIVTEVLDPRQVEAVGEVADMLQVGCRSMQNFPLLRELGRQPRPVLLKRGFCATLQEWLCAAEYIAQQGNDAIVLCERGIRCFTRGEYARNTLDINVIFPVLRACRLPLLLDPSHGTGLAAAVPAAARAALAAGVHGLLVECREAEQAPDALRSDGDQAITPASLARIVAFAGQCGEWL